MTILNTPVLHSSKYMVGGNLKTTEINSSGTKPVLQEKGGNGYNNLRHISCEHQDSKNPHPSQLHLVGA